MVQVLHNWTSKKQHLLPFLNVDHLPLDMEGFVDVLQNTDIVYRLRSNMQILKRSSMYPNHFFNKYSHTSSKSISSVNWPWLDEPLFVLPSLSISSCVASSKTLFPRDWIASNLNSIIGLISSKNFVIFCPTIIGRARRKATPKQLTSSSFCISKNWDVEI